MTTLTLRLGGRYKDRQCADLNCAQRAYVHLRERSGLGASRFPEGVVLDERGVHVARISYNGRAWANEKWTPEEVPLAEAPGA